MNRNKFWIVSITGAIIITFLSSCGNTSHETTPLVPTNTANPSNTASPSSTVSPPTSSPLPPTSTPIPPTRTPFPASCSPSDPSILEVIDTFEALANNKDVEGTMELFSEDAILEESFRGKFLQGTEEISSLWRSYYKSSPPCEFRDIAACGNITTFIWADLYGGNNALWPVVIEINDGKITYMDYYEKSTIEFPE